MKRFEPHAVGVQRGSERLFSAFEDGGEMWTGQGPREHRQPVRFDESFRDTPIVQIGLSMWDIDNQQNQRVDIQATEIAPDGFTIVFKTWGDTRVARVRAEWLAIGAAIYDEDWEV